jgi:ABC-type transporter Mla subunit MlaD
MIETIAVAIAFGTLGFTLLTLRRAHEKITSLESEIDAVEGHKRTLQEQRDTLKSTLETTEKKLTASEAEKQELERQRAVLAESAARLEKLRADLEAEVARLRREQDSLERRVVDFQGTWSHQLSTLEAEISTLIRQLGEFRKGTQLPITRAETAATAHPAPTPAPDPSWALSAPVGPRLAGTRPRPVNPEPAVAEQAAARQAP